MKNISFHSLFGSGVKVWSVFVWALLFLSCSHYEPAIAIITYTDGSKEKFFGEQEVYSDGSWHQGLYVDNGCLISSGFSGGKARCGVRSVQVKLLKK